MLALRMLRAHAGLFATLALVGGVTGALATGVPGYLLGSTTGAARESIGALRGADGGFRIAIRVTGAAQAQDTTQTQDATQAQDAQDGGVRRAIARVTGGAPLVVSRSLGSDSAIPARVGGATREVLLLSDPGLWGAARLTGGAWPRGADEASLQADAARTLRVAVGDRVGLGERRIRVTGLWRARDADDPRWLGDRAVRNGRGSGGAGPLVVDPDVWRDTGIDPLARWTIVPDAGRIRPDDLSALARLGSVLPTQLRDSPLGGTGVDTAGRLPDAVRATQQRVTAVLATAPVSLLVLGALAALTLVELARLLSAARLRETVLLRSRGAGAARLAAGAGLEALVLSGAGAGVGSALAAAVVSAGVGVPVPVVIAVTAPVGIGLGAALLVGGIALRTARSALTREQQNDSGRARRLASGGAVVLIVGAAVASSAQFLRLGSPLAGTALDPLAAPAPALAVVAVALLAVTLAPLAARAAATAAGRGTAIGALAARRLSRGLPSVAAAIVLVALAAAALVTAGAYGATLSRASVENRALRLGADVVARGVDSTELLRAAERLDVPHTLATASAATVGETPVTLVGVPADGIRRVAAPVGYGAAVPDRSALARAIAAPVPGIRLPVRAGTLALTATGDPIAPSAIVLRMLGAGGEVLDATLRPDPADPTRWSGAVPADARRLLAVQVTLPPAGDAEDPEAPPVTTAVAFSALRTADGALGTGGTWDVPYVSPVVEATPYRDLGAVVPLDPAVDTVVRLMPSAPSTLRAAVSARLAAANGLAGGSEATLADGGELRIEVRAIPDAVPGSGSDAVLVDLAALRDAELRTSDPTSAVQLWVSGGAAEARALRAALPAADVRSVGDADAASAVVSAASGLWIGASGAVLLAVIAVAAVVGADGRARAGDVGVFRALGVDPRRQGRERAGELAAVLGYGAVAGLLGGLLTGALLVPGLARAAVADPIPGLPIALRIDPLLTGLGVAALALALAAVVAVAAHRIRSLADTALVTEPGR